MEDGRKSLFLQLSFSSAVSRSDVCWSALLCVLIVLFSTRCQHQQLISTYTLPSQPISQRKHGSRIHLASLSCLRSAEVLNVQLFCQAFTIIWKHNILLSLQIRLISKSGLKYKDKDWYYNVHVMNVNNNVIVNVKEPELLRNRQNSSNDSKAIIQEKQLKSIKVGKNPGKLTKTGYKSQKWKNKYLICRYEIPWMRWELFKI